MLSDAPTVYALALEWALLPTDEQRHRAGDRLADLVRSSGFRISTGFVGTPLICDALTAPGHLDVAYRLLLQTGCPSWLYAVTMGATTVWERWDAMLPDGTINPGQMTSFNHYALGAVADWLHRTVAGLAPAAPGYRELLVRPRRGPPPERGLGAAPHAVRRRRGLLGTVRGPAPAAGRRPGRRHRDRARPRAVRSRCGSATAPTPGRRPTRRGRPARCRPRRPSATSSTMSTPGGRSSRPPWRPAWPATKRRPPPGSSAFLDAPSSRLVDALAAPGLAEGGQALHARLDGLLPP